MASAGYIEFPSQSISPRSISLIKLSSSVHLTVCLAIVIFGVGVPPIWQGVTGIIFDLEGYYGAISYDIRRVKIFICGLILSIAVSTCLGVLALTGKIEDCNLATSVLATRKNESTILNFSGDSPCVDSYRIYAYVELGGGAVGGSLVLMISVLAYREMAKYKPSLDDLYY